MSFKDWSETAADNDNADADINWAEGQAPSTVNGSARSMMAKLKTGLGHIVSVKDFGAVGDGVTDDSQAFLDAMDHIFSGSDFEYGNKVLVIPPGEFLVTEPNLLGQWTSSPPYRQHVTFQGSGRGSSTIIFQPGGSSDAYLYDGEADAGGSARDQQLLYVLFEKIAFLCDDTGMSGGTINIVKQYQKLGTPNQNFQFKDCYFVGPATVARAGTVLVNRNTDNCSENSFHNCKASGMKTIIDSTNPQAVNNYVFGCDWESMVGDIYSFNDGGGQLVHVGGSIIYGSSLASDSYILNLQATTGMNTAFLMVGIKTELNDTNARLVNLSGANNGSIVKWNGCHMAATNGTGSRTVVSVQPNASGKVVFEDCDLSPSTGGPYLYEFKAGTALYYLTLQYNGLIEFRNCKLPLDIHSRFSWGANSNGLFRIRGGSSSSTWNGTDPNISWDCDLLNGVGMARSPSSPGAELKTGSGLIYYWPDATFDTDGASNRLKLPVDSILKSIKVRKAAFGASGASYKLAVTNDDGTYTYGMTTTATQAVLHEFTDAAVWRRLSSGVDQIIRVVATKELAYNTQTANFTVGATLTDAGTSTTAKILADTDAGATGTLTLGFITGGTGLFGVGNIITDGSGGSATAGATTSLQGAGLAHTMIVGDIYIAEYY